MNLKYLALFQFTKYDIFLEAHSLYVKNPANFYSLCQKLHNPTDPSVDTSAQIFLVLPFKCSFIRLQTCDSSKCVLAQSKARCRHKFWVLSILVFKFAAICYMVLICKDQDLKIDCNLTQHYSWNLRGFQIPTLQNIESIILSLGTIQVLRHQRGGWVGSENGNF